MSNNNIMFGNITIETYLKDNEDKIVDALIKIPNASFLIQNFYPEHESKIDIKKWEKMEIFIPEEDA